MTRNSHPSLVGTRPAARLFARLLLGVLSASLAATEPEPAKARSLNELRAFFRENCVRCHGLDGSARSPEGVRLGGLDFTKATREFTDLGGPASEREIRTMVKTIRKGIFFGRVMPSWKEQLSLEDATRMVREVLLKAQAGKVIEPDPLEAPTK